MYKGLRPYYPKEVQNTPASVVKPERRRNPRKNAAKKGGRRAWGIECDRLRHRAIAKFDRHERRAGR